jgi:flagellar protein FlgJ
VRIDPLPAIASSSPSALKAAAARFEGLFMREMLKSMRAAKLNDGLLDNDADQNWADLRDQIFADTLAQKSPIGIAAHDPGTRP